MKKDYILGILFFGSIWGLSEAMLGGFLYRTGTPYSSIPLTVVAFMILTIAKLYLPRGGSAIFIGSVAMFYKFLNTPFFACHLLAIFLLGTSYELVFGFFKMKNKSIAACVATYAGYILFALTITYVFRYHYWTAGGFSKILRYVGLSGTIAGLANFIAVPIVHNVGRTLKRRTINPFEFKSKLATSGVSLITFLIWFAGTVRWF